MLTERDPPHYLKAIRTTNVPRRLVWMDCASQQRMQDKTMLQTWLCGAAGTTHFTSRRKERKDTMRPFDDPAEMWTMIDQFCTGNRRVVLFSYDLAVQLRLSQGLAILPKLGWSLKKIVLERTSAWASFQDDGRSLLMCDLRSWCPVEFNRLCADTEYADIDQRAFKAGEQFKRQVCMFRAGVIRTVSMQIIEWIENNELGPFRPTGSGQSYAAFRRRHLTERILVHDDDRRLCAERAAMWTGRCEAWQHGRLIHGPYVEFDMQTAYAVIARDCEVPTVAWSHVRHPTDTQIQRAIASRAVLARITVDTDTPCLPARLGERTAWPVGQFTTWVWDPELHLALHHCRKVDVHEMYLYKRGPVLSQFAAWVLDTMTAPDDQISPVVRRVLKHWSRCLVGRLGLRYRSWEPFATSDEHDLRLVTYVDSDEGTMTDLLVAGREWLILSEMREALESVPQIPSWVMSECRRRLWQAMQWIGLDNVIYVDTDSIIISARDKATSAAMAEYAADEGWTEKGEYLSMTVHGPRNYETARTRKIAGLPLTARQVAPLEFTGEVMRSIKESMRAGQLDSIASLPRHFKLNAIDLRRQHLPGGRTAAFTVQLPSHTEDD